MLSVYAFRDFAEALNTRRRAGKTESQAGRAAGGRSRGESPCRGRTCRSRFGRAGGRCSGRRFDEPFRQRRNLSLRPKRQTPAKPASRLRRRSRLRRTTRTRCRSRFRSSPGPVIRESSFPLKGAGQRTAPDRMQVRRVRSGNDKGFFPKRFPQSLSAAVRQMLGSQLTGTNSRPERHSSHLRRIPGDRYRDGHAASGPGEKTRHTIRSRFVIKY